MTDLSNITEECLPENDFGTTSDSALGELEEFAESSSNETLGAWIKDKKLSAGGIEALQKQLRANIAQISSFVTVFTQSTSIDFPEVKVLNEEYSLWPTAISEEPLGDIKLPGNYCPDFWAIRRYIAHVVGVPFSKDNASFPKRFSFVPVNVSADVISEANQLHIIDDLETVEAFLNATFPMLHEIDVTIHHDPEIPGRLTICFTLTVSGDAGTILDCESLFKKRLFSKIDTDVRPLLTFSYRFLE